MDVNVPSADLGDYEVPFKGIVEQSVVGIYILQDGRFQYVNETFARMCDLRRERLIGARLCDVANPDQSPALVAQYERRIEGVETGRSFIVRRTSASKPGAFEIHGTRVVFRGRPAVVGVSIDVTERERQQALIAAGSQRLRELVANANDVRENERNRVARELHDVVGGMLTAIKFDLSRLSWGIERLGAATTGPLGSTEGAGSLQSLADTAHQLIALTQDAVAAVRAISEGLRPGTLDHLGLCDTLSQELQRFEARYGIAARFQASGLARTLERATEIGLYRIFQEALTNVARHARATALTVDLDWQADGLRLQIADNGLGFADGAGPGPAQGHFGLLGMQERARELGGEVRFGVGPKSGACVTLNLPLAAAAFASGDTTT